MSNALDGGAVSLWGAPAELRHAYARGMAEARYGCGFPRDFDVWPDDLQWWYEYGRLDAANIAAAGLRLPPWDGRRTSLVSLIDRIVASAVAAVGEAIPDPVERP